MEVKATTTKGPDSSPFARQRHLAEQRRLDRQNIVARRVSAGIPALEHEHLQLVGGKASVNRHDATLANVRIAVQRNVGIDRGSTIHEANRSREFVGHEAC